MSSFIFSFEDSKKYKMKINHVISFVIIFISVLIILEYVNRHFVVEESRNFMKIRNFQKQKKNIEVLFLGDSHFIRGLDLRQFGNKTFDLSFPDANYIQSYYILKRYIREMPSLKVVVLPLSLHSFSSFRTDGFDNPAYFWDRFIDFEELSDIKGKIIRKRPLKLTVLDESTGKLTFIDNAIKRLQEMISGILQINPDKENMQIAPAESNIKIGAVKNVVINNVGDHFENSNVFDQDLLVYFEKTLKLCKKNNLLVVAVQFPVSEEYLKCAEKYISPRDMRDKIINDERYNIYINKNFAFSSLYLDRNDLFTEDGHHLNRDGSKYFSKIFSLEIMKLVREAPHLHVGE